MDTQTKGAFSWLAGHVALSPTSAEVIQEEKREGASLQVPLFIFESSLEGVQSPWELTALAFVGWGFRGLGAQGSHASDGRWGICDMALTRVTHTSEDKSQWRAVLKGASTRQSVSFGLGRSVNMVCGGRLGWARAVARIWGGGGSEPAPGVQTLRTTPQAGPGAATGAGSKDEGTLGESLPGACVPFKPADTQPHSAHKPCFCPLQDQPSYQPRSPSSQLPPRQAH